jgi:GNAT superfamily N-acetyltransferase
MVHTLSPQTEELLKQTVGQVRRYNSNFLHLAVFGADPSHQGQGYGRCCMMKVLNVADAKGLPVSLETCTESNRTNYWYYGFDQVCGVGLVRVVCG